MKVILLKNIDRIGNKFDQKEVADGFARNYLFPNNLAIIYTDANYQKIIKEKVNERQNNLNTVSEDKLDKVGQLVLRFKEKANEHGKLFAQVTKKMIINEINKDHGLNLKEDDLIIDDHLKETGVFLLGIKPNYQNKIKIIIEKDEKN
jgi:large subunit ribosomal protein L9